MSDSQHYAKMPYGVNWSQAGRQHKLNKVGPPSVDDLIKKEVYGDYNDPEKLIKSLDMFNIRSRYMLDGCCWINSFKGTRILDVGCGDNIFKDIIHNIVGLDKFNETADILSDIETYDCPDNSFDGLLIHGSIQYGEWDEVLYNFDRVMKWTKSNSPVWFRYRRTQAPRTLKTYHRRDICNHRFFHNYQWTPENIEYVKTTYNLKEVETWDWNKFGPSNNNEDIQRWHKFIKDPN
jgi:menaquinone-dependent protoporphyrinogen IX oxidase